LLHGERESLRYASADEIEEPHRGAVRAVQRPADPRADDPALNTTP